jgi:hypothetical protein
MWKQPAAEKSGNRKESATIAIGAGYMYDDLMDKSHPFGIAFATVSISHI